MYVKKHLQCPHGVRSLLTKHWSCEKAKLAVPALTFASSGFTLRRSPVARFFAPISPASLSASRSPVWQMSRHPGGIDAASFFDAKACSKRRRPNLMAASTFSVCCACRFACASRRSAAVAGGVATSAARACRSDSSTSVMTRSISSEMSRSTCRGSSTHTLPTLSTLRVS